LLRGKPRSKGPSRRRPGNITDGKAKNKRAYGKHRPHSKAGILTTVKYDPENRRGNNNGKNTENQGGKEGKTIIPNDAAQSGPEKKTCFHHYQLRRLRASRAEFLTFSG
jgi:hypothetical protein